MLYYYLMIPSGIDASFKILSKWAGGEIGRHAAFRALWLIAVGVQVPPCPQMLRRRGARQLEELSSPVREGEPRPFG